MRNSVWKTIAIAFVAGLALAFPLCATAQDPPGISAFTTEHVFTGNPDGANPLTGVVEDSFQNMYGTTANGGTSNAGALYKLTPLDAGGYQESTLHSFTGGSDGGTPSSGILAFKADILYGTTLAGGTNGKGVLFSYDTTNGVYKVLHTFTGGSDGGVPNGGVTCYSGILYGAASSGGTHGFGVTYEIHTTGSKFKVLHDFAGGSDGDTPLTPLTKNGTLYYGTTAGTAGSGSDGTLYYINPTTLTYNVIHPFSGGVDGGDPDVGNLLLVKTILYGTTTKGGSAGVGTIFKLAANGFFSVYSFPGGTGGNTPFNNLVKTNKIIYGTTQFGGANHLGEIYGLTIATDKVTNEYSFTGGSDGDTPLAGVLYQTTDDRIWGTTYGGGDGAGVVYRFNL